MSQHVTNSLQNSSRFVKRKFSHVWNSRPLVSVFVLKNFVLKVCVSSSTRTALHARPLEEMIARLAQGDAFTGWGGRSRPGVPGCRHQGFQRLNPLRRKVCALPPPNLGRGDFGELAAPGAGRDAVDLFRRRRAAVLFLEGGNFLFDLRPSLRRHGAVGSRDADDLESFAPVQRDGRFVVGAHFQEHRALP